MLILNPYLKSSAEVDSSAYLVDYQIPDTVTFNSGGEQNIFPIDERVMGTDLVMRITPEQNRAAYLEARFTLDDVVPVQPGKMQFYRDGSFIKSQRITGFLSKEEVSLPFARDERVCVEVLPDQENSNASGAFRRFAVDNRHQRFLITSFMTHQNSLKLLPKFLFLEITTSPFYWTMKQPRQTNPILLARPG